jgi:hypothetical protein
MMHFGAHAAVFVCGLFLTSATAETLTDQPQAPRAFASLCASGDISAPSVLAHADKDGWRREGAHLPQDFNPAEDRVKDTSQGVLSLRGGSSPVPSGHLNGCAISGEFQTPGIVAAVQGVLGFSPAFNLGTSATFFATWSDNSWHSAATLSRADFLAAKAEGHFFSIVASTTTTESSIMVMQPIPDAHH